MSSDGDVARLLLDDDVDLLLGRADVDTETDDRPLLLLLLLSGRRVVSAVAVAAVRRRLEVVSARPLAVRRPPSPFGPYRPREGVAKSGVKMLSARR